MADFIEKVAPATRDSAPERTQPDRFTGFLRALGDVSQEYGLAIADGATVYVMEGEDYHRSYAMDDESRLTFA